MDVSRLFHRHLLTASAVGAAAAVLLFAAGAAQSAEPDAATGAAAASRPQPGGPNAQNRPSTENSAMKQKILDLSAKLWQSLLQADKAEAAPLIDDAAVFVHMGATLDKAQELAAIGGVIQLKKLDVQEQSVRFIGDTAILLKRIRLTAVVNSETVTNPFVVTETYVRHGADWRLGAMSYTRIVY